MTIRVTVKNEDTSGNKRVIAASQTNLDGSPMSAEHPEIYTKSLNCGESAEFYVHNGNQIVVREVCCE